MIIDDMFYFRTSAGSEDLATDATTAIESDPINLRAAGYADGGGELVVVVRCKSTTAAVGASFAIGIESCATTGGTYVIDASKTVLLASVIANTILAEIRVPLGIKQFIKLIVTPAASMTGALTVNGAVRTE
jgi:hypothetical protein